MENQLDLNAVFTGFMYLWLGSYAVLGYYILRHGVTRYTCSYLIKLHVSNHILILSLLAMCQLTFIASIFTHEGYVHGWNIHIVEGRMAVGFLMFAAINFFLGKHLLEEVTESV